MLVPRSFRYYAGQTERQKEMFDEKKTWRAGPRSTEKSKSHVRSTTEPMRTSPPATPTKPVAVPTPQPVRRREEGKGTLSPPERQTTSRRKRMPATHDPKSLPPSVAALLAVTQIPRPKAHQIRRRQSDKAQVSIDGLVNQWKSDLAMSPNLGSSPALSMLLEEQDETEMQSRSLPERHGEDYWQRRSTSAESVPSLDHDDQSLLSLPSPPTPEYPYRHRRSVSNLKKDKSLSLPATVDCGLDHPLEPSLSNEEPDESFILSPSETPQTAPKSKARFTSNLTLSLQALKNAAITKITALSLSNASAPSQRTPTSPLSDDVLWSHPYLFPRFSPEVRPPTTKGTPSKAERRYLNPLPLTFEEQEAPFQQALHAPYLAEEIAEAPTIQMQTYHRGRRKAAAGGNGKREVDPTSELGRAAAGSVGVKMREPRENGDFLRVVVMEMNMRRAGKLESGRAKIWLPPRQVCAVEERRDGVPVRWRGVSAG